MVNYGCRIRLSREAAARFYADAFQPDLERLRRRDERFAQLARECPYRREGDALIVDVPDIDIEALLNPKPVFEYDRVQISYQIGSICVGDWSRYLVYAESKAVA